MKVEIVNREDGNVSRIMRRDLALQIDDSSRVLIGFQLKIWQDKFCDFRSFFVVKFSDIEKGIPVILTLTNHDWLKLDIGRKTRVVCDCQFDTGVELARSIHIEPEVIMSNFTDFEVCVTEKSMMRTRAKYFA